MQVKWYFSLISVLFLTSGCVITDYQVITDNDQLYKGNPASAIVNTNGQAKVLHSWQSTVTWPDGTDKLTNFIDQKADGTAMIRTYGEFTSSTEADALRHDDLYCRPDWNGCAIFTAPDNNDENLFDGWRNDNCTGARSLSVLFATSRYYGECGRARMSMEDRLALLNHGQLDGLGGIFYELRRSNFSVQLQKEGEQPINVPIFGEIEATMTMNLGRHARFDAQNILIGNTVDAVHSIVASKGAGAYTVNLEYMGVSMDHQIAFTSVEDISNFKRTKY